MPLRSQKPAKLSARAVYSKQSTSKDTSEKGRGRTTRNSTSPTRAKTSTASKVTPVKGHGRTKKNSTSPARVKPLAVSQNATSKGRGRPRKPSAKVKSPAKKSNQAKKSNLQKKNSPKTRKRKNSVSFKSTTEIIEHYSSEADLSSEGEETEEPNDEDLEEVEQEGNDVEVSDGENELESEEETESSGEEGDVEEEVVEEEIDEELASTDEFEEEEDDSENACYSFPEPSDQSTLNLENENDELEDANSSDNSSDKMEENDDQISSVHVKNEIKKENKDQISPVHVKKEIKKENTPDKQNSRKRKITQENKREIEEGERNDIKPPNKKLKELSTANLSLESGVRSLSSPGSSRTPSFSPRRPFSSNQPASSHSSPLGSNLYVDSMDTLTRLNKSVPCGNIAADEAFRFLIGPTLPVDFFHNMFEKVPFVVSRKNRHYYKSLFSGNDLNTMLKEHNLEYKVHLDVVKYVKGKRLPIAADGRAYYSNVWEDYKQGFSLRVRNPQAYNKHLWKMCSLLQEYFSSTVGCNIYLTPPKAQGFPPHYDDIDAFIVQVEGRKYWKVYPPRYPEEDLARYSSKDFSPNEIGDPIMQVCLNSGEMLYIPRGYIHQAATDADIHSLHLTFSTNQLNTWGDLLLIAASKAVEKAMLSDVTFRESISKDYMDYIGTCVADTKSFKRYELINKVKELAKKAMSYIDVDEAADLHSLKYIEASLPPVFNKIEKEHTLQGNGSYWRNGEISLKGLIELDTDIQLIRKRCLRLVIGDNDPRLYHTLENLQDPRPTAEGESSANYVEFEMEAVPSYLFLLNKYPDFVKVQDIPLTNPMDRISFATSLYENGLIITKEPLPRGSEEDYDWLSVPDEM